VEKLKIDCVYFRSPKTDRFVTMDANRRYYSLLLSFMSASLTSL
jgi:hypothetical protein